MSWSAQSGSRQSQNTETPSLAPAACCEGRRQELVVWEVKAEPQLLLEGRGLGSGCRLGAGRRSVRGAGVPLGGVR